MMLLTIFTVSWYYTSSKNAVATQQLVEYYQEHITITTAGSTSGKKTTSTGGNNRLPLPHMLHFSMMASLTALQLFVGLCIATFLSWGISSGGSCHQGSATTVTSSASSSTPTPPERAVSYLIGTLHYCGCLFTKLGFAYGSASILQVIQLLEPI